MSCGEPHETDCYSVLAEVYLYLDLECDDERRTIIREHLHNVERRNGGRAGSVRRGAAGPGGPAGLQNR